MMGFLSPLDLKLVNNLQRLLVAPNDTNMHSEMRSDLNVAVISFVFIPIVVSMQLFHFNTLLFFKINFLSYIR